MYQILPYLEEDAIKDSLVKTQHNCKSLAIPLYNCPSRRGATFDPGHLQLSALVDYAAAVGGPSRSEIGDTDFNQFINDSAPTSYFKSQEGSSFLGMRRMY